MKITVRCGVPDGGEEHGRVLGAIEREVPWFRSAYDWDRLRWEERFYTCPKHGELQIRDEDLLRRALNPSRPLILAKRPSQP